MKSSAPYRAVLIGVIVLVCVLGGGAVAVAAALGAFHENAAKTAAQPLTAALEQTGGHRLCETGDAGFGPDNFQPWYKALYAQPRGRTSAGSITVLASHQGYALHPMTTGGGDQTLAPLQGAAGDRMLTITIYTGDAPPTDCGSHPLHIDAKTTVVELDLAIGDPALVAPQPTAEVPKDTDAYYAAEYGTFAPSTVSGTGNATVPLPDSARAGIVTMTSTGDTTLGAAMVTAAGTPTGDLLSAGGTGNGVAAFGVQGGTAPAAGIAVTSVGSWTLAIAPIADAPALTLPARGTGDAVYRSDIGPEKSLRVTNSGQGTFMIQQFHGQGSLPGTAASAAGAYDGPGALDPGRSVVVVTSDGTWTIS